MNSSSAISSRVETILAGSAALLAGGTTIQVCRLLAPRVTDPFSIMFASMFVTMVFVNSFGLFAIAILLPWHLVKRFLNSGLHHHAGPRVAVDSALLRGH